MARAPRELSPAYAKRIASAEAKGKTRQAARGHKPKEHIERKQREAEGIRLSKVQTLIVFNWSERRLYDIHEAQDIDSIDVVNWAQRVGYKTFKSYRERWDAARKDYLLSLKDGSYISRKIGHLLWIGQSANVETLSWLYYH